MRAYYLGNNDSEGAGIDGETLVAEGILHWHLPVDEAAYTAPLNEIRKARGYVEMDQIHLDPATPNLGALCDKFYAEHHHTDEEIRFVIAGSGIFDLRDEDDAWMRVHLGPGDMIIVPADKHHRFTLDDARTITCKRLFQDTNGWEAILR